MVLHLPSLVLLMLSHMWAKIRLPAHRRRPVLQPAANTILEQKKKNIHSNQ
jgi:hypothetical protein